MAFLYINSRGVEWRKHSYSAGLDFVQCPYKYFLRRVMGWRERENKARFLFGRALEEAIQYHHDNLGKGAVEAFIRNWEPAKDIADMVYTKTEKSWESLNRTGIEMIKLYVIRQPSLPIPLGANVAFQREFTKEVFPNDPNYGGIEDAGKLDIISYNDPKHPMLAKVEWNPAWGALRPCIVDIKTSAVDFPETQGIAGYDAQLRRYSWHSGIRDVALLWFKKTGHTLQKGSSITMLETVGHFAAGMEAVVAMADEDGLWLVHNDFMLEEMTLAQGQKNGKTDQTKEAKVRRLEWLEIFAVRATPEQVTRQRLQFNSGWVTEQSANEAGVDAARQIVNIVNAWNTKQWPNTFGVRFPHDDRSDPYFQAFVLGDENYKKINFIKTDEDSLDELFEDQGEEQQ